MQKTFCDACGAEATDNSANMQYQKSIVNGTVITEHDWDEDDFVYFDLCKLCATRVQRAAVTEFKRIRVENCIKDDIESLTPEHDKISERLNEEAG